MRLVALALLLVGLAEPAGAQVVPEPAPLLSDAELRELLANPSTTSTEAYEVGVRFFEAKRYEAAESAWLRAYSLGRNPTLLLGVADTRQRRGDEPGAVAMLEQYLIERPDAPDRVSIEARIATLLQSPAVLVVRSEQPGRAILLDGVPVDEKTPAELEVAPGTHAVIVVGGGKQVGEKTVQVGYGEVKELDFTPDTKSDVTVEQSEELEMRAQLAIDEEDTTIRRAVISTGTIAAAALATGTVLGVLALQEDQSDRLALFANASFGLAALSAITSFTLFMTHRNRRKRDREREIARWRIESRGAGAAATWQF